MSKKNKKKKDLVEDEILTVEKELANEENLNEKDFLEFKRILNTIYHNLDDQT